MKKKGFLKVWIFSLICTVAAGFMCSLAFGQISQNNSMQWGNLFNSYSLASNIFLSPLAQSSSYTPTATTPLTTTSRQSSSSSNLLSTSWGQSSYTPTATTPLTTTSRQSSSSSNLLSMSWGQSSYTPTATNPFTTTSSKSSSSSKLFSTSWGQSSSSQNAFGFGYSTGLNSYTTPVSSLSGSSLLPLQSSYGSPFGSIGSSMPINYAQSTYAQPAYTQSSYTQSSYAQPAYMQPSSYTQPSYTQPAYAQPAYAQLAYAQPSYTQPSYTQPAYVDLRIAQSVPGSATSYSTYVQQPTYYTQNPLYYPQPTTTTQPTTPITTQPSSGNTPIKDLPNLSALWQGTYTLYDTDSEKLTVLREGQVTLGLTQKKNDYQISGYMTVNNWEITNENKRGRVTATVNYNYSAIDFISVVVKFYPDLQNDQEPTSDSLMYVWIFSGSIHNTMLECSLNISGPDNYSRAGTITLARKQS